MTDFLRAKSRRQASGAAVSAGTGTRFLPLTLAVPPIFFIITSGRRLRLTAIKARITAFLFVPPARRFFCPEEGRVAAGDHHAAPEVKKHIHNLTVYSGAAGPGRKISQ